MPDPIFDATGDDAASGGHIGGGRVSVRDLLYDAERRLTNAQVPSPQVDASLLLAWVLDVPRGKLFLHDEPTPSQRVAYEKALARRLNRVPLQHITGRAPFRRIELSVGPGVFIPRPETELVAEAAIRPLRERGGGIAVDLCSGSGAVGLSVALEAPGSTVYLVELDESSAEWTRRNAADLESAITQAGSRAEVVLADATTVAQPGGPLSALAGQVDVVVANPPYIPDDMVPREIEVRDHDPFVALYGGPDGLDVVRGIARTAAVLLRPGGHLVIEHADVQGPDGPGGGVVGVLAATLLDEELSTLTPGRPGAAVFEQIADRLDFAGLPRFTLARRCQP